MKNVARSMCVLLLLLLTLNCDDDDPIQYQLTTEASPEEGGNVSPSSALYNKGREARITAEANEEYVFKHWTGDASGNENPISIVMTDDMVITGVFEKVKYTLDIKIVGEGTIKRETLQAKSTDHESGTRLKLTAMPDSGWEFASWEGDFEGTQKSIEIIMNKKMQLTAHFHPINKEKVYVPDDNFEKALIDLGLDSERDDHVFLMNIKNVKELFLSGRYIRDLTGIEGFISLESLICSYNDLTGVDLSGNKNLRSFVCTNNNLETINISENTELTELILNSNNLEEIDLSGNETLHFLLLRDNALKSLDISALPVLMGFSATGNELTCIQVNQDQLDCALNECSSNNNYLAWTIDEGVIYALDCNAVHSEKTYGAE